MTKASPRTQRGPTRTHAAFYNRRSAVVRDLSAFVRGDAFDLVIGGDFGPEIRRAAAAVRPRAARARERT